MCQFSLSTDGAILYRSLFCGTYSYSISKLSHAKFLRRMSQRNARKLRRVLTISLNS